MSSDLLDKQSGHPLFDPATECLTPNTRPKPSRESDAALPPRDESPGADATQCIRSNASVRGISARPRVAGYEVLEELGRGGMGVVFKAWQHNLQRTVAVKMVIAGSFAAEEDLTRFRAEAMAVARLHHPHLLSIYEIGESNGLPFYAMEYMEGGSLARRLNGEPIAPRSAAALVRALAQAIDYAHKNGIVHRDLKPANILLDGAAETPLDQCLAKITDFGVAKHLHQDSSYTRTGDILGTPHYMAPEQAIGRSGQVGPAADVYSLGAILYELLTGRTPFHGLDGAAVLVRLTREEPENPSHWVRSLPRDLETICLKCLEKDPARRYASAAALAEDLARFLQSEPIQAKPASFSDRACKWVRRRPAFATVLAMAVGVAILGFNLLALMYRQAVDHAQKQDDLLTETKVLLADAYLDRGIHLAEKGDVRRGMHWMLRSLEMTQDLEQRRKQPSELADIIRMNLASWGQCVSSREVSLPHTDWVWDVAFTPDQRFVVTASKDKDVRLWHAETGLPVGPALTHPHPVWGVAFTPEGKTMFTACGEYAKADAGELSAWSADASRPGHFVPRGEPIRVDFGLMRLCVNADVDRLCVSGRAGQMHLYGFDPKGDGNGLTLVAALEPGGQQLAAFSPDGSVLATISGTPSAQHPYFHPSARIHLWDGRTGKSLGDPLAHGGLGRAIAFSKDSKYLIVGTSTTPSSDLGETSFVHVWDVAQRNRVAVSTQFSGRIKSIAVADNGKLFAVSLFEYTRAKEVDAKLQITDGHVQLWQLHADGSFEKHGAALRTGHVVWSMEFSPDSRMLLAGCENYSSYLWSVSTGQLLRQPILHEGNSVKVAFSKDGRHAVTASAGGGVSVSARLWEVPRYGHIGPPMPQHAGIRSAYWSHDHTHVWISSTDILGRWDPRLGTLVEKITLPGRFWFHRTKDEHRVMVDRGDDRLCEFDLKTRAFKDLPLTLERIRGAQSDFHAATDQFLQTTTKPSRIRLLGVDGRSRGPLVEALEYERLAHQLSADGALLAVTQTVMLQRNRLMIYNTNDMSVRLEKPLDHPILTLAFSPDGKTLALGGRDRQVQRLNVETGAWIGSPLLHDSIVKHVVYLGSDRLLATADERGQMLLWDAPTGKRVGPACEHHTELTCIDVHPRGTHILTATHNKLAMTWRVPAPLGGSLEHIKLWVETMTGMEMKEHDNIVPIAMDRLLEKRRELAALGGAPVANNTTRK